MGGPQESSHAGATEACAAAEEAQREVARLRNDLQEVSEWTGGPVGWRRASHLGLGLSLSPQKRKVLKAGPMDS